ncbi:unnamed protein product [Effrenium voratum]|uniref:Protein kinase domain-containing protein n=1 Tax=Effrenium voratum TaxID=2562239 RepID=A0AA36NHT8_9DINO|nr:unnamed protein product [Effrenium voratum]CAJ1416968.1 unnamed protein product [Effrenium voratum]
MKVVAKPLVTGEHCLDQQALELGPVLGSGGFATIFDCRIASLSRSYAAKVFKAPSTASSVHRSGFHEAEMLLLAAGCHFLPRVVGFYEVEIELGLEQKRRTAQQVAPAEAHCLLLTEKCDLSLQHLINHTRLSEAQSAFVVRSSLSALQHLHDLGIVHGDVKPGNILVANGGGRVVLADLGLAQQIPEGKSEVPLIGGSLGYLAPECLEEKVYRKSSDIFALGAVMYLLLFRTPAFLRSTKPETRVATLIGQLPLLPCGKAVAKSEASCELLQALLAEKRPSATEALNFAWLRVTEFLDLAVSRSSKTDSPSESTRAWEETTTARSPGARSAGMSSRLGRAFSRMVPKCIRLR